ncbi:hypothetical protein OE766_12330 [Pararhizobium sp. YC-54]|uniref:hypothetical protein n=1 Tax=Pararhizobium sp. YC-54 TaxID=2986920 RepID=UPI0021F73E8D|nr:hypothetical protein [Pararhizobium sp. YC-54]MCV9999037.1 hypothetical protein [Pararhizobium sp. YC-54]
MTDRGPTVINTGRSTAGWAVAVIVALVVIGGLLMFTGVINTNGGDGTDVNVNVPAVETPSADKPVTNTPATDTPATDTPATGTTGTPETGTTGTTTTPPTTTTP